MVWQATTCTAAMSHLSGLHPADVSLQKGAVQSAAAWPVPDLGDQHAASPQQLVSQADLVFAQPLEELDPSDTEQEKVLTSVHAHILSRTEHADML